MSIRTTFCFSNPVLHHTRRPCSGNGKSLLRRIEADGPWPVSILLDEAAMILSAWSGVNAGPAVLTVVPEAVDVAAEVRGVAAVAV